MGRPSRLQFPGACYYVSLVGNNRQDIFVSNADRRYFLSLARGYKDRYGLKIYAYCLLSREVHVLLETERPNLAVVMQGFNTVYTKYFNSQHNTVGHLFQGRYRALVVDKERQLAPVSRHIHLLPAAYSPKDKPWRYAWSSGPAYVEAGDRGPLIDSDAVLSQFGKLRIKQSVRYLQYMKEGLRVGREPLPISGGLVVGSDEFLATVLGLAKQPAPAIASAGSDPRRILADVAQKTGIPEEKLLGRLQWRDIVSARRQAIHRIWKEAKVSIADVARLFGRTPSAVSQIIRALEPPVR